MMATSSGRTPKHGGSHFGGAQAGETRGVSPAHVQQSQARSPRPALVGGRVSSRTAAATRRAGSGNVHRDNGSAGGGKIVGIIAGVLVTLFVVGLVIFVVVPTFTGSGNDGDGTQEVVPGTQVTLTIPEGAGAAEVAQILFDNGVIPDMGEFLSQVRRTEAESSIKSGSYSITTGADLTSIIDLLVAGPNVSTGQITIPEGYTLSQIAGTVEEALGIPADDFVSQAKASNYSADYPFLAEANPEYDTLEGYLFPKTYDFSAEENPTADTVIRAMLDQYQTEVASIDFSTVIATLEQRYGITVDENDIITMASIIEREAGSDEHRAEVASVLYNRLEINMALQSDATLVYSLGREVTPEDLQQDDPYNTYLRQGLTPTPICSPGLASIQAAAEPAQTSYLYFFLSGDYAAFSETLDEHNQAIANRPQ